ncbi:MULTISPECIES: hypothetical protein [Psychrobacter]|jgi:hypothetical protein|uniref:hypothetical protein n=1 Tax=Psychrobacter TaxID=497 RepID=UPI00078C8030|nr:hypothetical protein [Psychrobacter sp. P11G5]AMN69044.1 hypothetical protein AK825_14400 [Psychrobacter sp. P11G5]
MKKFTLEINEDELSMIRLSLSAALNDFRSTRVKYDMKNFLENTPVSPFAEQEKKILEIDKRLKSLQDSQ